MPIRVVSKLLLAVSVFSFSFLFALNSKVLAGSLFSDNFNTYDLDSNKWIVLNETDTQILTGEYLNVRNIDAKSSAFIENSLPFNINNDINFKIRFKFNSLSFGSGIALNDTPVPLRIVNGDPNIDDWTIFVWPTSPSTFKVFSVACPEVGSCLPTDNPLFTVSGSPAVDWHDLVIVYSNGKYGIKLDDSEYKYTVATTRSPKYVWIGNPMITQGTTFTNLFVDYIDVFDSASSFPYYSQTDARWGGLPYDRASTWADGDATIGRWGCALTSVSMVLKNYGVKDLSGVEATPDILNTWLTGEPDGYIAGGLLNWLAVTRYAHESYVAGKATSELEYTRGSGIPPTLPSIVNEGGHFVVAHASESAQLAINDPNDVTRTSKSLTDSYFTYHVFSPSFTDLSYFLLTAKMEWAVNLTDELGNNVPIDWQTEQLNGTDGTAGASILIGLVPKPASGVYHLRIDAPTDESGELYLYDQTGAVEKELLTVATGRNDWEINFDKTSLPDTATTTLDLSPPPIPTLLSPADGTTRDTAGMVMDWSDVVDPSTPVTYKYRSSWSGGSYGPVSTGTNSYIAASGSPEHTYLWSVQACDSANNCSEWSSPFTLTVDNTAPTADLVFPPPGPSSTYFEVVFSELVDPKEATNAANYYLQNWPGYGGSGDLTGDASISYNETNRTARINFLNAGWYISPEQQWGVQNIHDLAGHTIAPNPTTEYSTPMVAPTVSAPTTTPNPTISGTQVWSWLAAVDSGSGTAGYEKRIFDVTAGSYLDSWLWIGNVLGMSTSLADGEWKMEIRSSDRAGNVSESALSSSLLVDMTAPSTPTGLHFDNPSKECGGYTNEKIITIDWDDASDNVGVAGYEYSIDYPKTDGTRGSWTTFFTTSSYRGSLNEGIHYIKVRSKDNAGNYSPWSESCSITYDSVMPELYSQTTFTGWHNSPVTSYFDFRDDNLRTDYIAPSCEISSEGVGKTCSVIPNVCDLAGNCYTQELLSNNADLDFTKPLVTLETWGSTLAGRASDEGSGLKQVDIRLTKPGEVEGTFTAVGTLDWSYTILDAKVGVYKAIITSVDVAGNRSEEVTKEYEIAPSAPASLTTEPSSSPSPSPTGAVLGVSEINNEISDSESEPSSEPSMSPITNTHPTPTPQGAVLGEETMSKWYWWLLLLVPLGALVIWRVMRAKDE